ncbi:MAG: hypothetical protein KC535_02095 [Nanoarchaeota archaeon]|nr:hypothetical protein [Nanoarchaeota archaeon]
MDNDIGLTPAEQAVLRLQKATEGQYSATEHNGDTLDYYPTKQYLIRFEDQEGKDVGYAYFTRPIGDVPLEDILHGLEASKYGELIQVQTEQDMSVAITPVSLGYVLKELDLREAEWQFEYDQGMARSNYDEDKRKYESQVNWINNQFERQGDKYIGRSSYRREFLKEKLDKLEAQDPLKE